jgi:hypothetical protein
MWKSGKTWSREVHSNVVLALFVFPHYTVVKDIEKNKN